MNSDGVGEQKTWRQQASSGGSGQWAGERGLVSDQLATTHAAGDATEVDGAALGEPQTAGSAARHGGERRQRAGKCRFCLA